MNKFSEKLEGTLYCTFILFTLRFSDFQDVLSELESVIENATFLSIDGEFTGLNSGPDAGPFDTPAQYYGKLRAGSMDFLLVQFGLSVFTYDSQTDK